MTSGAECHKIRRATAIKETGVPSPPPAPERRDTGCKRAPAGEAKTVPQRGWKHPRPAPRNRSREGPLGLNLGGTTKRIHALSSQTRDGSAFFRTKTEIHNRKEIFHHGNCDPPDSLRLHGAAACPAAADGADDGDPAHHLQPIRLHSPGHPGHRGQRGAAGQGRRRNREADLSLPEGRCRSVPAV